MNLNTNEAQFLTALAREQNQTGCRGPAHDLLRQHAYPDAPRGGPGSLAFAYEAVPLIGVLLKEFQDLQRSTISSAKAKGIPTPNGPGPPRRTTEPGWKKPDDGTV